MRAPVGSLIAVCAHLLRICEKTPPEPVNTVPSAAPSAVARASISAAPLPELAQARIGGTVLRAGEYFVELALYRSGSVEASVSAPTGRAIDEGVALRLSAQGTSGAETLKLVYSPEQERFLGHTAPQHALLTGTVNVELNVHREARRASAARVIALNPPQAGGHVFAVGDYGVELRAQPDGLLRAAVYDANGERLRQSSGLELGASLRTPTNGKAEIPLHWDDASQLFTGKSDQTLAPTYLTLKLHGSASGIGRREHVAFSPPPNHGGQVIAAGFYSAEIVADENVVDAYVADAAGKPSTQSYFKVELAFGPEDSFTPLALNWNPQTQSYRGKLKDPRPLQQPLRISLGVGERTYRGGRLNLRATADW